MALDISVPYPGVNLQLERTGRRIAFGLIADKHSHMALTTSETLTAGQPVPAFSLPDVVTGRSVSLSDFSGSRSLVVIFLCRHCPYVVHVLPEITRLAGDYLPKGVALVGISANDASKYPDDSAPNLAAMVAERGIPFPVLHDASQQTARAFQAVCTPEFYVFDAAGGLYYHGRLDGSTPGNKIPSDGADLRQALDVLLAGAPPPSPQHPSMGCNIKWK